MRRIPSRCLALLLPVAIGLAALFAPRSVFAGDRPLELVDLMKMRQIEDVSISDDGRWAAYALVPDRGDGEAVARATRESGSGTQVRIERGSHPALSRDGRWLGALVEPPLVERLKAEEKGEGKKAGGNGGKGKKDTGPKAGLALVPLTGTAGERIDAERVEAFAFSGDGRWVAWKHFEEEKKEDAEESETASEEAGPKTGVAKPESPEESKAAAKNDETTKKNEDERVGTRLVLVRLADGLRIEIPHVESWAFDATGAFLAYSLAVPGGEGNGILLRDLDADGAEIALETRPEGRYTALTWTHREVTDPVLGYVAAVDDEDGEPGDAQVRVWESADRSGRVVASSTAVGEGWFVPSVNTLTFSRDGERLFFGRKPVEEKIEKNKKGNEEAETKASAEGENAGETAGETVAASKVEKEPAIDPYDLDALVEKRGVTVWHGDDPLIQPNQKERWKRVKDRTYTAMADLTVDGSGGAAGEGADLVLLADRAVREVRPTDNPHAALGIAEDPWFKERTWEGMFYDLYRVSLTDGSRRLVASKLSEPASLSPDGRWVLYYLDAAWHLFDGATGVTRDLTGKLPVPFADEDWDYPSPPEGYSVAGWVAEPELGAKPGSEPGAAIAVLITDKYDLWQLPVDPAAAPLRLTAGRGREEKTLFRAVELDPEQRFFAPGEPLLLTEYHDRDKSWGFATVRVGEEGVATLAHEPLRFRFVAKAKVAGIVLYTRESYTEFPDLWVAPLDLSSSGVARGGLAGARRISDANPQIADFAWGSTELVEWTSDDGIPLQGVLIKPGNYREGRRVPVLVYYYRFFSQRLHEFNQPVVNHRPSFPFYASHGYALFLPDIRFEIGRPGFSAVKALVPGVKKLIAMGIADPDAIGLHGHSWSGYQTAFVITQTDLFKAAVAGAPVSNMTSAYGGIRLGSGLARQFQYERSQSRIGGSLWERRSAYIESSPLFYADRIHTPLLIEFGDRDDAVPWTQGIELYLAMRRLGKEVVFLQYHDEPHHLEKYPDKVDYTIKMKQFFDHYLKGEPAPEWLAHGVPYRGE